VRAHRAVATRVSGLWFPNLPGGCSLKMDVMHFSEPVPHEICSGVEKDMVEQSSNLVRREILRFLGREEPEVLCIRGAWGVGKTYSWKRYLKEAHEQHRIALSRYAYVSLFGINSLDELRYSIFENTVLRDSLTDDATLETFKSVLESAEGWSRKSAWLINLIPG
jgi:hypothetical protein